VLVDADAGRERDQNYDGAHDGGGHNLISPKADALRAHHHRVTSPLLVTARLHSCELLANTDTHDDHELRVRDSCDLAE